MTPAIDPRYVAARRILLDALVALSNHTVEPGIWVRPVTIDGVEVLVPVDLIVPTAAASPGGRRGARLGEHGRRAARKITGLEAALFDHDTMTITSLDPRDHRSVPAKVAGTAALLVAKAHKLGERIDLGRQDRLDDKDALDCLRLMQSSSPADVGATLRSLQAEPIAADVTATAIGHLDRLFGGRGRPGIRMAADALRFVMPEERVQAICTQYTTALTAAARTS